MKNNTHHLKEAPPVQCHGCALMLAMRCYEKHWWFHLVRDPLVWGMYFLAFSHGIDAKKHVVRKTFCKGCIRFMKAELEMKSPTFNFLNRFIGPWFAHTRNNMLTKKEMEEAKRFAQEAMNEES
ncbi:MAG: hypothetical protein LBQ73_06610 [Tannerellaceae bacterium]|jgi:hypothetical protein|nr:hypothetical protein [Tannerellaceae bacterium]